MKYYLKIFVVSGICYILGCVQSYIGLFSLKDKMSSLCMECSFLEEILYNNLITLFFLIIFSFIFKFIKFTKYVFATLYLLIFSIFSILANRDIFNAREASWSTYLDSEITAYGISSLFPFIFVSWIIIFLLVKWFLKNNLKETRINVKQEIVTKK